MRAPSAAVPPDPRGVVEPGQTIHASRLRLDRSMIRPLPLDLAALVSLGLLEEVQPGLFRRPRLPSRAEVHGAHPTHDQPSEPAVPEEPNP